MIRSIENSNDLIGNRNRDLPACSIVPPPTTRIEKKIWKEAVTAYFNAVSEHSRGGIDENGENPKSGYSVPSPKFKTKTPYYGNVNRSISTPNRVVLR
jgi:hypothetical protein